MSLAKEHKNLVKKGQLWKKNDTGIVVEILQKRNNPYWSTRRVNKNKKNGCHIITEYDLIKHYTLL